MLHLEKSGEQTGSKGGYLEQEVSNTIKGRESDDERILAYNIGISIQDIYFAAKILELVEHRESMSEKFWV